VGSRPSLRLANRPLRDAVHVWLRQALARHWRGIGAASARHWRGIGAALLG
jgi:hypothetical protein